MPMQVYHVSTLVDHIADALDAARKAAQGDQRWCNALETAASFLLEQDSIKYDPAWRELAVNSPSGATYYVRCDVCQCTAFAKGQACWHRACLKLTIRALELRERANADTLREVEALADELHTAEGGTWYEARQRAEGMLGELAEFGRVYDAWAERQQRAHAGARIARAQAAAMELFA